MKIRPNTPISDLVVIHIQMCTSREDMTAGIITTQYIVHRLDAAKLIKAQKRLHYDPGVNPHNGKRTPSIQKIETAQFLGMGPFWWSSPSLKKNDNDGVQIAQSAYEWHRHWTSPEYEAWCRKEYEADLRAEFEAEQGS